MQLLQQMMVEQLEMSKVGSNGPTSMVKGNGVAAGVGAAQATKTKATIAPDAETLFNCHSTVANRYSRKLGYHIRSEALYEAL